MCLKIFFDVGLLYWTRLEEEKKKGKRWFYKLRVSYAKLQVKPLVESFKTMFVSFYFALLIL